MNLRSLWQRKKPYAAVGEEERMARYVYLLHTLPPSVIERAHASAFGSLSDAERVEMFDQLRPFMKEDERQSAAATPTFLARLMTRAQEAGAARPTSATAVMPRRDAAAAGTAAGQVTYATILANMAPSFALIMVADSVLTSSVLSTYFTDGAGSLGLASEPAWVGESFVGYGADGTWGGSGSFDGSPSGDSGGGFGFGGDFGGGFGGDGGGIG